MSALFNYYLPFTALRMLSLPKLIVRRFDLFHLARHNEDRPLADVLHAVEIEHHLPLTAQEPGRRPGSCALRRE